MADIQKSSYRGYLEVSEASFKPHRKTTLQVRYTIIGLFSISHRLIRALRDICHAIFAANNECTLPRNSSF